jgi:hypothetical protein
MGDAFRSYTIRLGSADRFDCACPGYDGAEMNLSLLRCGYPIAVIKVQDCIAYIDGIMAWRSGDDAPLKAMIRESVRSSLQEVLSLAR